MEEQKLEIESLFTPLLAIEEAARCLLCHDAPCSNACPAHTDPGKFIRSLRFRNLKGAAEAIRENNPLGGICARVCPTEKYCEGACSRCGIDRPIQIAKLQAYLTEYEKTVGMEILKKVKINKEKIAVIGSGPAGIVAAASLALKGYNVSVFEKQDKFGGWMTYGIPEFRLATELVESEIEMTKKLGVEFINRCEFGRDETFETLKAKGFKAILLATGYSEAKMLPMFNESEIVETAVDFLSQVKVGGTIKSMPETVLIIGGGDVAMDAAMTAKTLGSKNVKVVAIESLETFPASQKELDHARHHNISIFDGFKPVLFDGKAVGFESLVDNARMEIIPDKIILAIGQQDGFIKNVSEINKNSKGNVETNNYQTNLEGIFAAGDIVEGDKTVVYAIKTGKEAAEAIDQYLGGTR
ncbi:MAG: FAD-dependent oxidoreductase [Cellulosilyticaceae bacterium]